MHVSVVVGMVCQSCKHKTDTAHTYTLKQLCNKSTTNINDQFYFTE